MWNARTVGQEPSGGAKRGMPLATHEFEVGVPVERVWRFVSAPNNWARYIPGFHRFEESDADHSTWWLQGTLGPLVREIVLAACVVERQEPSRIYFTLQAVGDPIGGLGAFFTEAAADGGTRIRLQLELAGQPPAGPIINMVIGARLSHDLKSLAQGLAAALQPEGQGRSRRTG